MKRFAVPVVVALTLWVGTAIAVTGYTLRAWDATKK